jgi:hypothetical protein
LNTCKGAFFDFRRRKIGAENGEVGIIGNIEAGIYIVREHQVMLDVDLAKLYGVDTKVLIQSVKRHMDPVSPGFFISIDHQGIQNLEVTDCDLKFMGRTQV